MLREALLTRTLVELADTLVDDFDVVELLSLLADRCVEVLDVAAAGLMVAYPGGELRVMASSSHAMALLELFELQSEEGPCPDCYRSGEAIVNHRLATLDGPWPRFAPRALAAGFRSVHALPMRLRGNVIGALNLFRTNEGALNDADVAAAQALADVATIAILQHRAGADTQAVNEQLHQVLNSRIVIEQAKGMAAEAAGLEMDQAFRWLRDHARRRNLRLLDVANDIIDGALSPGDLDRATPASTAEAAPASTGPAPGAVRPPLAEALSLLREIVDDARDADGPPPEPGATGGPVGEIDSQGVAPEHELRGRLSRAGEVLDLVEAAAPVDAVEVVAAELADLLGADRVSFLTADLGGDALIRFVPPTRRGPQGPETGLRFEKVALADTPYQAALVSQQLQVLPEGDRYRLVAPVSDRGDAIGAIEVVLRARPDDACVAQVAAAARLLAYVVIASRRHTDLYESAQRDAPFSLPAEIQRQLLPSAFTCEAEQFTIAGWLEPASHVGGDSFDYSVDRDILHVSMTDATGRDIKAAQLATLMLASLRNTRRAGVGLAEQARRANDAMTAFADADQFVTGLLLRVELSTGNVSAVNAGHPRPYRLRNGHVTCVDLGADIPFGVLSAANYREQRLQLEPGDRLIVVTDGLLERNHAPSHLDVADALAATAKLHPRQVVHAFKASVLAAAKAGLDDDVAVVCIDWHGSAGAAESGHQGREHCRAESRNQAQPDSRPPVTNIGRVPR